MTTFVSYPAQTGVQTVYTFPFQYVYPADVKCFIDGADVDPNDYTVGEGDVTFLEAPTGDLVIRRLTGLFSKTTQYTSGSPIKSADLNTQNDQFWYSLQELWEQGIGGLGGTLVTPGDGITVTDINNLLAQAVIDSPIIDQLLNDTSVNAQAIIDESTARIAALATETQARIDAVNAEAAARLADLTTEAAARAADISNIQTQVDADISNLTALDAALTQEIADRIAGVSGVTTALAQEVTDRTNAVQANAAGLAQEILDRQGEDVSLQTQVDAVVASVGDNSALIATETTARVDGDDALASQLTVVSAAANRVRTFSQATEPLTGMEEGDLWFDTDDNNQAYRFDGVNWVATDDARIADALAQIATETTARVSADDAFATQITNITAQVDGNSADITTANAAITTESSARATAISGLQTQVDANAAGVLSNSTAISTESSARASAITALTASVDANAAAIVTEQTARSDADSALSTSLTALTAEVDTNTAGLVTVNTALATETSARVSAISGLQTQVDGNLASIGTNATAISNLDGATTTQFTALTARMDDNDEGDLRADDFTLTFSRPDSWSLGVSYTDMDFYLDASSLIGASAGLPAFVASAKKYVGPRYGIAVQPGDTIRVRWRVAVGADGTQSGGTFQSYAYGHDTPTSHLTAMAFGSGQKLTVADGYVDIEEEAVVPAGVFYIRPYIYVNNVAPEDAECIVFSLALDNLTKETGIVASVLSEQTARVNADSALASDITALTTRTGDAEAGIVTNATAITTETSARTTAVSALQTSLDTANAAIVSEENARVAADSAQVSSINGLDARLGTAEGSVITNAAAVVTETDARVVQFNALQAEIDTEESVRAAAIITEQGVRSAADQVNADATSALTVRMGDAEGAIVTNTGAIATETDVRTGQYSVITSRFGGVAESASGIGDFVATFADEDLWGDMVSSTFTARTPTTRVTAYNGVSVWQISSQGYAATRAPIAVKPGDLIESRWSGEVTADGTQSGGTVGSYAYAFDKDGVYIAGVALGEANVKKTVADGRWELEGEYTVPAGTYYLWPYAYANLTSPEDSTTVYYGLEFRNINAAYNAEAAAQASLTSVQDTLVNADAAQSSLITGLDTRMGDAEADVISNTNAISTETGARTTAFTQLSTRFLEEAEARGRNGGDVSYDVAVLEDFSLSIGDPMTARSNIDPVRRVSTASGTGYQANFKLYIASGAPFAVSPGDTILCTWRVSLSSGGTNSGSGFTGSNYTYDEDGAYVGGVGAFNQTVTVIDESVYIQTEFVVPAGVYYLKGYCYNNNNTNDDALANLHGMSYTNISREEVIDATISTLSQASSDGDQANADLITALTTRMGDAEADIITNSGSITTANTARSTIVSQLSARVRASGASGANFKITAADEDAWGTSISSTDIDFWAFSYGVLTSTPYGQAWRASTKGYFVPPASRVSPGDKVRLTFSTYVSANGAGGDMLSTGGVYGFGETGDTAVTSGITGASVYHNVTDGLVQVVMEGTVAAGCYYVRPYCYLNGVDGQTSEGNMLSYEFENVTELEEQSATLTEVRDVLVDTNGDVNAFYTLKTEVNGRISGFGLSNSGTSSEFAILADKFLVVDPAAPGGTPISPFAVVGGVTYISNAMIEDASITNLKIGNLEIDSEKLAPQSVLNIKGEVSTPSVGSGTWNDYEADTLDLVTVSSFTVKEDSRVVAKLTFSPALLESSTATRMRIYNTQGSFGLVLKLVIFRGTTVVHEEIIYDHILTGTSSYIDLPLIVSKKVRAIDDVHSAGTYDYKASIVGLKRNASATEMVGVDDPLDGGWWMKDIECQLELLEARDNQNE